jgi:hypothetical protein
MDPLLFQYSADWMQFLWAKAAGVLKACRVAWQGDTTCDG